MMMLIMYIVSLLKACSFLSAGIWCGAQCLRCHISGGRARGASLRGAPGIFLCILLFVTSPSAILKVRFLLQLLRLLSHFLFSRGEMNSPRKWSKLHLTSRQDFLTWRVTLKSWWVCISKLFIVHWTSTLACLRLVKCGQVSKYLYIH